MFGEGIVQLWKSMIAPTSSIADRPLTRERRFIDTYIHVNIGNVEAIGCYINCFLGYFTLLLVVDLTK